MSTRAVYQHRSAKQNNIWSNCISPTRYINRVQQSKNTPGAAVYRHGGISTAISKAKVYLAQLYINSIHKTTVSTSAVYQRPSAKQKHTRRSNISAARYTNRDQQMEILSGATVYQQCGTSTAISTAEAYLAQLYINSHQKLKAMPFWMTQPCRPERYINRDQQQEKYLAQIYVTSVV